LAKSIHLHLGELIELSHRELLARRDMKYRNMGAVLSSAPAH
jgi:hypothetical protein